MLRMQCARRLNTAALPGTQVQRPRARRVGQAKSQRGPAWVNHLPAASQALPRVAIDDHGQVHLQRRRCQLLHTAALHNMANTAKDSSAAAAASGGVHHDVCVRGASDLCGE